ncbi:hypothetical protein D3C72_1834410 [compost metagenome]
MMIGMYAAGSFSASRKAGITTSAARSAIQAPWSSGKALAAGRACAPAGSGKSQWQSASTTTATSSPLTRAPMTMTASPKSKVPAAEIMVRPITRKVETRLLPPRSP